MNWLILNGRKSTEVAGLMIQSLPPVQKPQMRTQIEQVDGRDGDIITNLGYAAYDRIVKIGLRGNYDEDDVVQFFNSSGKVIFSNEPDKVYDYSINETFSLNRLRIFREADVVFHVQPYKHSVVPESVVAAEGYGNYARLDGESITYEYKMYPESSEKIEITANNSEYTFDGSIDRMTMEIPSDVFFRTKNDIPVTPGVYDLYLTIKSGTIDYGGIRFGVSEEHRFDTGLGYALSDDTVEQTSTGQFHTTIEITQTFVMHYLVISFQWYYYDSTPFNRAIARFTNFTIENIEIYPRTNPIPVAVLNRGNAKSAPTYTIENAQATGLQANGGEIIWIRPSEPTDIVIDSETMKAYIGTTNLNRICTGNYANLELKPGKNIVNVLGIFDSVTISNYSRWI